MSAKDDVVEIINRTALIENLLNQVIEQYCRPAREAFPLFWNVMLDSSIITLGAKIKVAMAISQEMKVKLNNDALHKLLAYRNAFAHHKVDSHPTLCVGKNSSEDELHFMLYIITSTGKIQEKRRDVARREFDDIFLLAKDSLLNLLKEVRISTHQKEIKP